MPELPDVERYRRHLARTSLNRRIAGVTVRKAKVLEVSAGRLRKALAGRRMKSARRRGKHLLVRLDDGNWLTLHFGMTGRLLHFKKPGDDPKYDRVRFDFADGSHLAFDDRRQLGRIGLAADAGAFIRKQKLGPDALDPKLSAAAFLALFGAKKGNVKAALMDQSLICGIGNIFSDEILFQAGIDPRAKVQGLERGELARLYRTLRRVLKTAVARGGGSEEFVEELPKSFLTPHRGKGARCPRCRAALRTFRQAGRTAYYCPNCQTGGRPSRGTRRG